MRRPLLLLIGVGCALTVAGALIAPHLAAGPADVLDITHAPTHAVDVEAGICPWRSPEADLKRFFPSSTEVQDETLILSRWRPIVEKRLGHAPGGADNALRLHRILRDRTPLGVVITRYVRGESGAIELVLAVDKDSKVIGARLQRLREPDEVARALQSPAWLGAFEGKTARSEWRLGRDIPQVIAPARPSANAILDGARTALILLEVGKQG